MVRLRDVHTWKAAARTTGGSCCLMDFLPLLTMLDQLRASASKHIWVSICFRVSCLVWVSNAVHRMDMTVDKMLFSVPTAATIDGRWAHA